MKLMKSNDVKYKLKLSIIQNNYTIDGVLCEVYIPQKITDSITLVFHLDKKQSEQLNRLIEFSIYGEIKDFSGQKTIIKATQVYLKESSTRYWGHNFSESLLIGEPIDLTIITFKTNNKCEKDNSLIKGIFWLTPCIMLEPQKSLLYSYTGEVTIENSCCFKFILNNYHLKFDHYYKYLDDKDGNKVSFAELVAEFETDHKDEEILPFEPIDDFLMLTSFSARQRCVCLGQEIYDSFKTIKFYRRNIFIPKIKRNPSRHELLIDIKDFKEFIKTAYKNFISFNKKDLIRQAIYKTISSRENSTLESNYLTLYSALETIVLFYRQNHELEFIIPLDEWNGFKKDIKNFIKKHPQFSQDSNKRKLIYEKLPELNRVSFATAFTDLCKHYNIDIQDLWPVVDRSEGISLSDIRNKLIHGDIFRHSQKHALISALEHLRWIVERSILSILNWPYSKSNVSSSFLSENMAMYREWRDDRNILSKTSY